MLSEADEIVNVDVAPEDLLHRLREGKIYSLERINTALENFFRRTNLNQLRELTLREIASQIDIKRRHEPAEEHDVAPDQVMVCLSTVPNLRMLECLGRQVHGDWAEQLNAIIRGKRGNKIRPHLVFSENRRGQNLKGREAKGGGEEIRQSPVKVMKLRIIANDLR